MGEKLSADRFDKLCRQIWRIGELAVGKTIMNEQPIQEIERTFRYLNRDLELRISTSAHPVTGQNNPDMLSATLIEREPHGTYAGWELADWKSVSLTVVEREISYETFVGLTDGSTFVTLRADEQSTEAVPDNLTASWRNLSRQAAPSFDNSTADYFLKQLAEFNDFIRQEQLDN